MRPRLLIDTHVLVRWLVESRRLPREQLRALEQAVQRHEPVAFSAMTLIEIAVLAGGEKIALRRPVDEFFSEIQTNPVFELLPITYEIAAEAGSLLALRDPADRAIVATARIHNLQLVTSASASLIPSLWL